MRVVVNLLAATGRKTGIGHYATQLVRCLRERAAGDRITGYPPPAIGRLRSSWDWLFAKKGKPRTSSLGIGQAALRWHFRTQFTTRNCDLYHEPNFIPLPTDLPTVATIHDLSALLHPEWHPADRVAHFERHFRPGLNRCEHFLTDSDYTRHEVIQMLHLPPERVTRAYIGVRPGLCPMAAEETAAALKEIGLPPRYLLYFGTIEPRKNVLMLMRAYCTLPEAVRARWPLLLAGGWGWRTEAIADYYHAEARHRNVRHLGYVADEQSAAIYNGARALIYPSLYEGFGLPPVEMLACGGAVLASTAGPIMETVAGQAHLIAPDDFDGWRDALVRVVEDDDWWMSLRRGAVEKARPYTWGQCAADTMRVYRKVCGVREPVAPAAQWTRRAAG